jgi:putative ABC transport system permease protein
VKSGYFGAMRIPVVHGRDITPDEEQHQAHVMLVDEHFVAREFGARDPIGQRVSIEDASTRPEWFTIVGVVHNIEEGDWDSAPQSEMFFPYWTTPVTDDARSMEQRLYPAYMTLVVRSRLEPRALQQQIARAVNAIDRDAPIAGVITMRDAIASQVTEPRFYLILLGLFAAVALLLAAIGIYCVISYSVSNRRREIGIMLALGADRRTPFRMIVRQGIRLAVIGSVMGIAGALVLTRFIGALLYNVSTLDPMTFVAVPLALIGVGTAACALPARRAANVDPAVALRSD